MRSSVLLNFLDLPAVGLPARKSALFRRNPIITSFSFLNCHDDEKRGNAYQCADADIGEEVRSQNMVF